MASPGGPCGVSTARRRFGYGLVGATLFLIFAGAEVKSRQAGLSVPDWPLSYGQWWPPMVGNVFYEHGHRTVAAAVGLLTLILAIWTARSEARPWVRTLAWCALGAVVAQGLLGGLTVIFLLPTAVSIGHALLAQTFLCMVVWLAHASSREGQAAAAAPVADGALAAAAWAAGAVYLQLILGALMRHTESGLAVPFFPTSADGSLLPAFVTSQVVIHMLHRGFAVVVLLLVLRAALAVGRARATLRWHAAGAGLLVLGQVALGAAVIWTAGVHPADGTTPLVAPVPASLHVLTGAVLLATCWSLALRVRHLGRADAPTASRTTAPGGAAA